MKLFNVHKVRYCCCCYHLPASQKPLIREKGFLLVVKENVDYFLLIGSIYCYRKLSCYLNQVCHTELKNTYR